MSFQATSKVGRLYSSTLTDVAPPEDAVTRQAPSPRPLGIPKSPEAVPYELVETVFVSTDWLFASRSETVREEPAEVSKRPRSPLPWKTRAFQKSVCPGR